MSVSLGRVKGCIPVMAWRMNLLLIVTDEVICHYIPKFKAKELLMPAGFSDIAISRRLVKLCDMEPEKLLESIRDKEGKIKISRCVKLSEIRKVEVKKGFMGLGGRLVIHTTKDKLSYSLICGRGFGIKCDEAVKRAVALFKSVGVEVKG